MAHEIPEIRFAGFADPWERRKLGEIGNTYTGLSGKTSADFGHGDASFITYMNVYSNPIANPAMVDHVEVDSKQKEVAVGDVCFTTSSETPEEVGMSSVITEKHGITYLNSFCFGYRPVIDFDLNYLAYMLRSDNVRKDITLLAQGISRYNISKNKVMEISVPVPEIKEQVQIGSYFKNLDHLITLHQRKVEKLQQFKKAMLIKMFPKGGARVPEIRFSGFTGDWERRTLGEICEIKDSARIPNSEWTSAGIPYIRASDVTNEDTNGVLFISPERYEFYKKRTGAPAKDDVLFNGGGEIGKSLLITEEKPMYVQGGAVLYARTSRSDELVGQYLKTYFETTNAKSYIDIASAGGTMKHFTLKPAQEMPISFPTAEEQQKIGSYFASLDHLISLQQRKAEKLQQFKKAMLAKMFA